MERPQTRVKTYDEKRQQWPVKVSPKLDGIYARATAEGIRSKGGKPLRLPKTERRLRGYFRRNPDAVVEGEIYRRGMAQEDIQSAVMRGDDRKLRLHVHPADGKRPWLGVKRIREKEVKDATAMRREYGRALKSGHEGVVLRRGQERVKLKPFQDSEYKVARALGGKRNLLELEGGIRVQARAGLKAAPGQVVTVRHGGLTRKGKPKAAVAERVREHGFQRGGQSGGIDTAGMGMKLNRRLATQMVSLEEEFDDILEFAATRPRLEDEDEGMSTAGKVAAGTAGAAAVGGAAYGAKKARDYAIRVGGIVDDGSGRSVARPGMYRKAAGQAVADVKSGIGNAAERARKSMTGVAFDPKRSRVVRKAAWKGQGLARTVSKAMR